MPDSRPVHAPPLLTRLQGPWRRVVFVTLYELIAIAAATLGFMLFTGHGAANSGVISVICSVVAVVWNVLFNAAFELWESRQRRRGRSVWRRVAHAVGFEGGLALLLVPLLAWWFGVGLWQALVMDLGLLLFFLAYTFAFNWGFDRLFGLPAAAA
ncbi:MAG: PACE efflux transporter [Ottowia sp.]|uniref:PACE efflux transporter n=1 Tax=Ottowia sp. TaxID=1898956 RepID=UPI0039E3513A